MKHLALLVALLILSIIPALAQNGAPVPAASFQSQKKPADPDQSQERDESLRQAVLEAVSRQESDILAFLVQDVLVDNFQYSSDGEWAAAWMALADPETGEVLPGEPGLALAERDGSGWRVLLPADAEWLPALKTVPDSLLSEETRQAWLDMYAEYQANLPTSALGGYLLPWPKGERKWLSRSVGHDRNMTKAHYSFDFYQSGQMWNVYASRGGTVFRVKNDTPTCYQYHCGVGAGNYIVLRDDTTSLVTYQLYLHLALDSIPPALMTIGAPVRQGQFVGIADNTGQSWGHHLHFQVHTSALSYWADSIDITFDDVPINGGRPRVSPADPPYCKPEDVCEVFQSSYISGNTVTGDFTPPFGNLLQPSDGDTITETQVLLSGWASDADSGLYSVQFIARAETGSWFGVGDPITEISPSNVYVQEWDLCSPQLPAGPVSVAMRLRDRQGNQAQLAGLRHYNNAAACPPPPVCTPAANQAALYSQTDYQGCVLFGEGSYPTAASLGTLGDNKAASIQVGSNVQATLFMDPEFKMRGETFTAGDASLADNLIGLGTLSSLQIGPRGQPPAAPLVDSLQNVTSLPFGDLVTLVWENAGGAQEYQVEYLLNGGLPVASTWQSAPYLHLPALSPGFYTWKVRGRSGAALGPWSQAAVFEVTTSGPTISLAAAVTAPYTDDMEASSTLWTKTGLWGLKLDGQLAHQGTRSWWHFGSGGDYDRDGLRTWNDLTSPPILIPGSGFSLRFWSRNETEGSGLHWDQRWVQISENGGPFYNILQLKDDPASYWVQSPFIDLSPYAGKTLRVRFRFDTIDHARNSSRGWGIDDFSITSAAPPTCDDEVSLNDTPAQAVPLQYGASLAAAICPPGDVDYYRFSASTGERIMVDIQAQSEGSLLDAIVSLYDSDGASLLAEADDREPGVLLDPLLGYSITRSGIYYLKVKAWDHPSSGSPGDFYTLKLEQDSEPPAISLTYPKPGLWTPDVPLDIRAEASDLLSGISRVVFYWHDANWLDSTWKVLGTDRSADDGWSAPFNPNVLAVKEGVAFYARAYDGAGNAQGAGVWNVTFSSGTTRMFLPLIGKE